MGLFDDLKKLTKNIGEEIEKSGVKDDFAKFGKEVVSGVKDLEKSASNFLGSTDNGDRPVDSVSASKVNELPELFNDFPRLEKAFVKAEKKETDKYTRVSMDYKDVTDDEINEYTSRIETLGYLKMTDVRYEKGKTYIIVDPNGNYGLNIVFHIKK